jgi:hypothetical protein
VSLQLLREDRQLQELVPAKALAAAPVKDAKLDEALAKECQATLSYVEHTLVALARMLPREAMTEAQETVFLSLQRSLAHSAALAAKSAGKAMLRRRDLLIQQMQVSSSHLKGSLHTAPLSGTYLFHDSLPDTVEVQQRSDALNRPPEGRNQKVGPRPVASPRGSPERALSAAPSLGDTVARTPPLLRDARIPTRALGGSARTRSSNQVGRTGVIRGAGPPPPLIRAAPVTPPSGPFREATAAGAPRSDSLKSTPPGLLGGMPPDSVVGGRLQRHTDFWDRWCQKGSSVPDIVHYGARLLRPPRLQFRPHRPNAGSRPPH